MHEMKVVRKINSSEMSDATTHTFVSC